MLFHVNFSLTLTMAATAPSVEGSGSHVGVSDYASAITSGFPRVSRPRIIESSIEERNKIDVLPVNLSSDNVLRDNYLEFRIPGTPGHFLDLSTLAIELQVSLRLESDNSKLDDGKHVMLVNGLSNTMFKSCNCYLNEQLVEGTPVFNILSFIRQLTNIGPDKKDTLARSSFYYRDDLESGVSESFTEDFFTSATSNEKNLMKAVKDHGLSMTAPLFLDLSTIDQYLADNVNVRIRLELSNREFILNTDQDGKLFKVQVDLARVWLDRVTPYRSALEAFNNSLRGRNIEYTFTRSLYKSYVLASNQTSLLAENLWGNIIPSKLFMVIIDLDSFSGKYSRNGLYFSHADLSETHITLNGNTVYHIATDFPYNYSRLYYTTLQALGLDSQHTLTYDAFANGRTVCAFNFVAEEAENSIAVERSGNLRVSLNFKKPVNKNRLVLFLAETLGVIEIDEQRLVRVSVRA